VSQRKEWLAVVLLMALVLAVFWKATLGGIFYFGDIYQLHYPLRSAYARELARLSLPLWTTDVLAGYPLLAEGQLGALYPPNLVLYALLPVPIALNISILGHFVLAALGAYFFVRRLGAYRTPALCAGLVYALGGFLVAHLNHVNILTCAAWLPWLFLLTERLFADHPGRSSVPDAALLALGVALECLAGHVQVAILSLLAVLAYALYLIWALHSQARRIGYFAGAFVLGAGLAAPQLLPGFELAQLSVRAGGLDASFFTSFSLHPLYLVSLLSPFVLGNPYPNASVELVGYVGWLPLLLACVAPLVAYRSTRINARRTSRAAFFAALGLVGLLLALGRWNPLYTLLLRVPVLNLFRVPARYLYLFAFGAAVLCGLSLDGLLRRLQTRTRGTEHQNDWVAIVAVAVVVLAATARVGTVDDLVALWRWLPYALAACAIAWLLLAWWGRHLYRLLSVLAVVLIVVDLFAFNAVFSRTYNQTMSLSDFTAPPRSLRFFRSQPGVFRTYTAQDIVPVMPVMRESFYPNLSLIQGLPSANGLFPLVPLRYARYVEQMTPRMLDLLGVKYYLIPQVLPVDESSELRDVEDPFALNPVGRVVPIAATQVAAIEVESYLSHSVNLTDGEKVAEIRLRGIEGEREAITLQAGWHTAEWAYDRSDVGQTVRHSQPAVARSWPARSGFPPEDHRGFTYRTRFALEAPVTVKAVEVRPFVPNAFLRIERITLVDAAGNRTELAHLAGQGDHTLTYRSEDVAVYENADALPRAFIVHQARAIREDAEASVALHDPAFDPASEVLLATDSLPGQPSAAADADAVQLLKYDSQEVAIEVRAAADGYLVLTDSWYPGWQAKVDGKDAQILRADLIFRAVFLPAGEHVVEFVYAPQSFRLGLWVGLAAFLVLLTVTVAAWLARRRLG